MVTDGMGLLIFTGGKLDVALYNDMLFRQKNRLLPCALKSLTDETIHGLVVEPLHPSPLEKLLDLKASALERVPVKQFMSVEEPSEVGQVRVLARWNNPRARPRSSSDQRAAAASCSGRQPLTGPETTGRPSPALSWRPARPSEAPLAQRR